MIEVVDYGAGNLRSVLKGIETVGGEARLCRDPEAIAEAAGVVFPGQGAFDTASRKLVDLGFTDPLREYLAQDRPFFGICLGLQLLFETSEEAPGAKGLGVLKGTNRRFAPGKKIPHMGWNAVSVRGECPLFDGVEDGSFFYFVHSYFPVPQEEEVIAATSDYEEEFCCAVRRGSLTAVQFHPEKSQKRGLQLLGNFVEFCKKGARSSE
jgi:imidazole glycerol phosphate synthase glutamine amidotransferase subunit